MLAHKSSLATRARSACPASSVHSIGTLSVRTGALTPACDNVATPEAVIDLENWGGDARSAVHVETDVALVGDQRLARVDPDAHAERTIARAVADLGCGRGRGACPAERREERVALRVDLDTRVPAQASPDDDAVGGEELRILVPVLVEKPRRAVDVGEEKCHRPRGRSSRMTTPPPKGRGQRSDCEQGQQRPASATNSSRSPQRMRARPATM